MTQEPGTYQAQERKGQAEEAALIAAILKWPEHYPACAEILEPADFGWRAYGQAWEAMGKLAERGIGIDAVTVGDELDRAGALKDFTQHINVYGIAGRDALFDMRKEASRSGSPLAYAAIVKDYSAKRQIDVYLQTAHLWCLNGRTSSDILADLEKTLQAVRTPGRIASRTTTLSDLAELAYQDTIKASDGESRIIPTGYGDLDHLFGGFEGPDLSLIAALPGQGKTAFIVSLIKNMYDANPNRRILVFTLEMGAVQLYRRLISAEAGISYDQQKTGKLTAEDWTRYRQATDDMVTRKTVHINDVPAITPNAIRQEIRRVNPEIVFLDYIQLASPNAKTEKRNEQVGSVARDLKNACKEFDIPIVAAAQLNRDSTKRVEKRPILQELADSSELEKAADNVFFLHRDDPMSNDTAVILAKRRNGAIGERHLIFVPNKTRFESKARV